MATIRNVIEGLQIIEKYGSQEIDAQHDVIYAGPDKGEKKILSEDAAKLEELGWFFDEEFDCYAIFT